MVHILTCFVTLLLARLAAPTPPTEVHNITFEYPESATVYTADYEVVDLFCPVSFWSPDTESDIDTIKEMYGESDTVPGARVGALFIQAEVVKDEYHYKGLYSLRYGTATKLLHNGRDFAASRTRSTVFLAATDGIYVYNTRENKVEKYGTISDSLIGIAVANRSDVLYVLSADHILYKVTDNGTEKEVVSDVKDATQMVFDYSGNLYFLNEKKHVYVKKVDTTVSNIKGLSYHDLSFAKLLRPPINIDEGLLLVAGNNIFKLSPNGPAELVNIILDKRPSAFSIDAVFFHYYAYKKRIHPFNMGAILTVGTNYGFYMDTFRNS